MQLSGSIYFPVFPVPATKLFAHILSWPIYRRFTSSHIGPFSHVGMVYGGPFLVKEHRRRNARPRKVYLALFVCMSVKAGHLEVVSDLTTDAFLAALLQM